jgi:hypothetical protein
MNGKRANMSPFSTPVQPHTRMPSQCNIARKRNKMHVIGKEEINCQELYKRSEILPYLQTNTLSYSSFMDVEEGRRFQQ